MCHSFKWSTICAISCSLSLFIWIYVDVGGDGGISSSSTASGNVNIGTRSFLGVSWIFITWVHFQLGCLIPVFDPILPVVARLCFEFKFLPPIIAGDFLDLSPCFSTECCSDFHGSSACCWFIYLFWSTRVSVILQKTLMDGSLETRFCGTFVPNLFLNPGLPTDWSLFLPTLLFSSFSLSLFASAGFKATSIKSELYWAIRAPLTRSFSFRIFALVSSPTRTPWYFLKLLQSILGFLLSLLSFYVSILDWYSFAASSGTIFRFFPYLVLMKLRSGRELVTDSFIFRNSSSVVFVFGWGVWISFFGFYCYYVRRWAALDCAEAQAMYFLRACRRPSPLDWS